MTYNRVPSIITGKDLDYLSDMFSWNYGAFKSNMNAINEVKDEEIKEILNNSTNIFKETIMSILTILASGGTNE